MTNNLQKYPKYKPSGVEWLGDIPEHWEATKVKNVFRLVVEPAPKNNDFELLSVYTEIGVKPRKELEERGNKASTTDGYWFVKKGDIVVNKLLAWMGAIGVSDYDGVTSPAYDILRAKVQINSNYYHYLFRNEVCIAELKKHSRGIMDMRLRLYFDKFGDIVIPFPDFLTQQKIVEFLDRKTAQIDQAIAIKIKQIELLKERRQILIHQAVTKGIKSDVKMKDSGVEWIGEIPEHWEVKRIKNITSKIGSGVTPSGGGATYLDSGIPLLRSQNILFGKIELDGVAYISEKTHESMSNSQVRKGDILLNITGGSIGRCHFVDFDLSMNVNQHVCIIRPTDKILSLFLNGILTSNVGQGQIWFFQQGGGREGLNFQAIKNFLITLPPKKEQIAISEYIENISHKIATAISLKEQEIEKMKEYKSVLINGAVTGKIKV